MAWQRDLGKSNGFNRAPASLRNTRSISSRMNALNTGGQSLVKQAYPSTTVSGYDLRSSVTDDPNGKGAVKTNANYNSLMGVGLYGAKNKMLEDAYNSQMSALGGAYDSYLGSLAEALNATKAALWDSYNRSKKSIMDDSRASLKQAYINRVLQEKNLDQSMAAQGLSGGATETTRASMSNNYGNARNEINRTTNNNLSNLEGEYNENLAAAMSAYNQAVANAELQRAQQEIELQNALVNGQLDAMDQMGGGSYGGFDEFMASLQGSVNDFNNFQWTPSEANNPVEALELQMGGNLDNRMQNNLLAALQAIMNSQGGKGAAALQNPMAQNYLAAILNQLQGAK